MKINKSWMGVALLLLGACSSTPHKTTMNESQDRGEFVKATDQQLDDWQKQASSKTTDVNQRLIAVIRDTRVELRELEAAPSNDWYQHKARVESRLERIRNLNKQKAE